MRIVVCVKQIAHTYARTGMDPDQYYLSPEDQVFRINPCDELAMGMALHAKKLTGKGKIFLLTLGPIVAGEALLRCMALGADHLCQVEMEDKIDPWQKSVFLSQTIRNLKADLVFCGKESLDTRNGQMGAFLAHHLTLPFVSCVRSIKQLKKSGPSQVERNAGRGTREIVECPLPAVFSVDPGAGFSPMPTWKEKRRAGSLPVRKYLYNKDSVVPKVVAVKTFAPRPRPKPVTPPNSRVQAFERVQQLLTGSLVEKKGEMLAGNLHSQVEGIVDFLKNNRFLPSNKEKNKG
jgi:electron transfer flavoprotein beta subunit